jgi:hypothetical protein
MKQLNFDDGDTAIDTDTDDDDDGDGREKIHLLIIISYL